MIITKLLNQREQENLPIQEVFQTILQIWRIPLLLNITIIRVNSVNTGLIAIDSENNSVNHYSRNTMKTESFLETQNASTYSSRYVNTPKVNTHQRWDKSCCVILLKKCLFT